jgi:hypothetical protein
MASTFAAIALLLVVHLSLTGCEADSEAFYMATLGLNEGRIFVANAVVAPPAHTITMYDLEGNFLAVVSDLSNGGFLLRGMAMLDPYNILASIDTPDELWSINIFNGRVTEYASNALLAGNIFDVVRQSSDTMLVAETSTIERFVSGSRVPAAGNPHINTVLGACTIATARGMAMTAAGRLVVASNANNRILLYDVSTGTSACLASNATFGANQPIPVVGHQNGNIYFGTQVNDAIYSAPQDLSVNPVIILSASASINNPTAMAVPPQ